MLYVDFRTGLMGYVLALQRYLISPDLSAQEKASSSSFFFPATLCSSYSVTDHSIELLGSVFNRDTQM